MQLFGYEIRIHHMQGFCNPCDVITFYLVLFKLFLSAVKSHEKVVA